MASTDAESHGVLLEPEDTEPQPSVRAAVDAAVPHGIAVAAAVAWRLLVIAAAVVLVGYAITKLLVIAIPFLVALLLTSLLRDPAEWLQARGVPRTLAAVLVVGGGVLLLAGLLGLIIPPFVDEASDLAGRVEDGVREVARSFAGGPFDLTESEIDRAVDRAIDDLDGNSGSVASGVLSGALIAAEIAAAMLLTIFLTFFMVRDGDRMWAWLVKLPSPERRRTVRGAGERAWQALSAYVRGVAIVATVDAVFIGAGLVIVGVPLAFQLTVLTFLAAFFPIVGAFAAGGAAVLVALVANGVTEALIILALIIVVQQLEGNVLYPVLVGSQLKLHPVAMLLVLGVGGVLAGVAGAFLAVPIAAVVAAVIDYARSAERHAVT
jgi:predicted PurR-regulated permease PerM